MRNRFLCELIAIPILTVMASGQEPIQPKLAPKVITATRQVTLFAGLERRMLQAMQQKDTAGLQEVLADDFAVWMPNASPMLGKEWLASVLSPDFTLKSFAVRQLSVTDLGETAVATFVRIEQTLYKNENGNGEFCVVDLWKRSGNSWKLARRTVAKIGAAPQTPAERRERNQ